MSVEKIGQSFVQEFVIGFGFFSGLWINVGINPETEILNIFSDLMITLNVGSGFNLIFWLLPIMLILSSLVGSFFIGGWPGIIAVGLGFLAGLLFTNVIGVVLLIIAIILGGAAPHIN